MTVRTVTKSLAGMEDLAAGVGKIQQVRAGLTVEVGQIDQAYAVVDEAALADIDVANFTYGRIGDVGYRYDASATAGQVKSNIGPGWWLYTSEDISTAGEEALLGGPIWPKHPYDSISVNGRYSELPDQTLFVRLSSTLYRLDRPVQGDSTITEITETEYSLVAGGNTYYLLPDLDGVLDIAKYTLLDFTGTVDATNALLNIASISEDRHVKGFDGILRLSRTLYFPKPKSLDFDSSVFSIDVDVDIFDSKGVIVVGDPTVTLLYTTVAPISKTERDLGTFAGIEEGEWLAIYNPVDGSYQGSRVQYRQGEYALVDATSPSVIIRSGALDDYPAGCEIYKLNVITLDVKGSVSFINSGSGYPVQNGLVFNSVVDLDLSNLSCYAQELPISCTLTRCINVAGSAVRFEQRSGQISSPSALEYGLLYNGCQIANVNGEFHSERHGCTSGSSNEGAIAVNRGLFNSGRFTTTGRGNIAAADYHGNSENCGYGGYIEGVQLSGDNTYVTPESEIHSVPGLITAVNYRELKSTRHSLRGVRVFDYENHPQRGVIDVGGSSVDMDANTDIGGDFDWSDMQIVAPNQAGPLITCRNRGATGINYAIDVARTRYAAPSITAFSSTQAVSGVELASLKFDELIKSWLGGLSVDNSTVLSGIVEFGEVTVDVTTADLFVQDPVVFAASLPRKPRVTTNREGGFAGLTLPVTNATSVNTNGFTVFTASPDGANFNANQSFTVTWEARVS